MSVAPLGMLLLGLSCAWAQEPDVIVVGAGAGGLATALEAARGGARVTVVDMASVFGGHAVMSEGGLSFAGSPLQKSLGISDTPDLMFREILQFGRDANEQWVRLYADRSLPDVHDWLVSMGLEFTGVLKLAGSSVPRFHVNLKRGFGVVEPLYRECLRSGGIEFVWNTRVTKLQVDGGRVIGVAGMNDRTGAAFSRRSPVVVLATGGFQSNLELVRKHWPRDAALPQRILVGAGVNAVGSGLDLATGAGGVTDRLDHQWNYPRGIVDPRKKGSGRGIHVDYAERFMRINSRGDRVLIKDLSDMLAQPGGRLWLLFDSDGRAAFQASGTDWADRGKLERLILDNPAITTKSQSLEELAAKMGLPAEVMKLSIVRNNAEAASGGGTLAVLKPPFHAMALSPLTRKSMGGVVIDMECRALDAERKPIPGLYAVGEVTGFGGLNGKAAIEGTFIAPAMLQGRIVGRAIAKHAGRAPLAVNPAPPPA